MATYLRERGVNVRWPVGRHALRKSRSSRDGSRRPHDRVRAGIGDCEWTATRVRAALSTRLLHAGVTVRDEAAASAFYHDVLGMDEIWRGGFEPAKTNWVNMRLPEGADYLEYMLREAPSSRRQLGVDHHICLLVPDIQAGLGTGAREDDRLDKRAALEPPRIGRNQKWQLNLYDPDGTRVELMEPHNVR